ncbi:MAG: amidohydrolase family protein [Alphaproteobacteria bacterium]|nr:amidohydrolase family protein [Alphaproteobacteria bacterium]
MAKAPKTSGLILPSDPLFYELPPPPGSEPERDVAKRLTTLANEDPEEGEAAPVEGGPPTVPGACDGHIHIFADPKRFPPWDRAPYRPAPFTVDDYRAVQRRLGLDRVVVVQSSVYGFDHDCLIDALEALDTGPSGEGIGHARGVAAVSPEVSDGELRDLEAAGCVATRFQMRDPWRLIDWTDTDRLAGRVHDLAGWDVALQMDGRFLHEVEQRIRAWPGRVILDHLGCFLGPIGDRGPGMRALLRLIDADKLWVKLSGPEESGDGPPRWQHQTRIARQLVRFAPERLVWGSNWPHPSAFEAPPDDRALLDLLLEWTEDESLRDRILLDNAAELWRFPEPSVSAIPDTPSASPTKEPELH